MCNHTFSNYWVWQCRKFGDFLVPYLLSEKIIIWDNFGISLCKKMVYGIRVIITLAQANVISQASVDFFPIRSQVAIAPRFFSCVLVQLQKFVHASYFPACALVLKIKRINCYSRSYLLHLYKLIRINWVIKFLFNCSISSFRRVRPLPKLVCSIFSLVFRWCKCCKAQHRFCVKKKS